VWAKVRVTTGQTWVESSKPLPAGRLISADDLVLRTGPRFPFGPAPLSAVELAAGRVPLHQIPAATPVFASMLAAPAEVARGDKVSVEIVSGAARLSFETAAESSGRTGDSILVRNPATGRLFPARIEARGKVRVKL
jgi:flagella basal body P-ring formation protein FlgA